MKIDRDATCLAPPGWEIWTTGRKWQAMRKGAKPNDKGAWGPLRTNAQESVEDSLDLEIAATEKRKE